MFLVKIPQPEDRTATATEKKVNRQLFKTPPFSPPRHNTHGSKILKWERKAAPVPNSNNTKACRQRYIFYFSWRNASSERHSPVTLTLFIWWKAWWTALTNYGCNGERIKPLLARSEPLPTLQPVTFTGVIMSLMLRWIFLPSSLYGSTALWTLAAFSVS
jgi:hypothetical protein